LIAKALNRWLTALPVRDLRRCPARLAVRIMKSHTAPLSRFGSVRGRW
jgi:hypothetical protein